jgi:hypothetical protein
MGKDRLLAITCHYNHCKYNSRLKNFQVFSDNLEKQGVAFKGIELVFPGQEPELAGIKNIEVIVGKDVMWQKERLLNILINKYSNGFSGIAWLDGDIIFENSDWAAETVKKLEDYPVVQPFTRVFRMPVNITEPLMAGDSWNSFASVYRARPNYFMKGIFDRHGHTGFAWAARSDVLKEFGLYDGNISGSGDHVMSHIFAGDWESKCIRRMMSGNKMHHKHLSEWAKKIYRAVRGKIGYVEGNIYHLWHGEMDNRKYVIRNRELAKFNFNPYDDIKIGETGLWEWATDKHGLHEWAEKYFSLRKEDGE